MNIPLKMNSFDEDFDNSELKNFAQTLKYNFNRDVFLKKFVKNFYNAFKQINFDLLGLGIDDNKMIKIDTRLQPPIVAFYFEAYQLYIKSSNQFINELNKLMAEDNIPLELSLIVKPPLEKQETIFLIGYR